MSDRVFSDFDRVATSIGSRRNRAARRNPSASEWEPPSPFESEESLDCYLHHDLANLSDFGLWQEEKQAEVALAFRKTPHRWFVERVEACRAESAKRGRR